MNKITDLKLDEDEFGYEAHITLTAWSGFQSRNGAYGAQDSQNPSDGTCYIRTGGDMVVDDPTLEDYHEKAFNYMIENQESIKQNILNALLVEYPNLQDLYGYDTDEKATYMPDVHTTNDFKNLIGISNIHLLNIEKDGHGYVGFEFGCTWDDEHGLGIMTHKNRIIKIGGGDTAFLTWIAREDIN